MRRFSSYGPPDREVHYYAPRSELIESAYKLLMGDNPEKSGHYITVWAPRQTGKSWLMQQILFRLKKESRFDVLKLNLENLKDKLEAEEIIDILAKKIGEGIGKEFPKIKSQDDFQEIFKKGVLDRPLILILDEFDSLADAGLSAIVSAFRNIYMSRNDETELRTEQKTYLLHSVALIGIRSAMGIENMKGSPFNVQRSLPIPNLSYQEVNGMFQWYSEESGQMVEQEVIDRIFSETNGQPGLTCWFGELLTETYNSDKQSAITIQHFEEVLAAAVKILPNNNILNIVSKSNQEPFKQVVLELFKTDRKMEFTYDNNRLNYLYMNGVITYEEENRTEYYVKFSSPFVQKRLFNYFSHEFFSNLGSLVEPYKDLNDVISDSQLNIRGILTLYQDYLKANSEWLFKSVPRRSDMRIYEAIFHFNLFAYLNEFLKSTGGRVVPEFPTGNGKIDLIIHYANQIYGLELKSFTNTHNYRNALNQAARYAHRLKLKHIHLVFFVESIDRDTRQTYEAPHTPENQTVTVHPIFVETGA